MVVYYHLTVQIPTYTPYLDFHGAFDSRNLGTGVHIFFVISGFIMMATTQRVLPGEFLRRRLIRIVPLYWLLTIAVVILSYLNYFKQTVVTPDRIAKSLLFVPYVASSGRIEPLLVPGWTLNVEMFFYLSFSAALCISRSYRSMVISVFFAVLVLGGRALSDPIQSPVLWLLTREWMLEFCTGMLIGQLYLRSQLVVSKWICLVSIVCGFGILLSGGLLSLGIPILYVLPATLIVLGIVGYEVGFGFKLWKPVALLGDASYSIYLSHLFALALLLYHFIEKPLHNMLSRGLLRPTKQALGMDSVTVAGL
jgi:exopolysaccharide production protein ExoZ